MRVRVHRGRLLVSLQPHEAESPELLAQMSAAIGSFNPGPTPIEVSCALSAQNLRKLRRFRCKVEDDDVTRETIKNIVVAQEIYDQEILRGNFAKTEQGPPAHYTFKMPPFAHQVQGFNFMHAMKTPALFGSCGVGKTFVVSTFMDSLVESGKKITFLVVCPVNLIVHVWEEDIAKFTSLSCVGLREPKAKVVRASDFDKDVDRLDPKEKAKAKRRATIRHNKLIEARFAQDVDVYIINPENMREKEKEKRLRNLLKRRIKDGYEIGLVIDESSKIKSRTSSTYKVLKRLREMCSRCIIMTGTPAPNGILDLWSQFAILDKGMTLQPSFRDFRDEHCYEFAYPNTGFTDRHGNNHPITKWVPRAGMAQKVYETIKPRMIRFRTEDCIDLPPRRFLRRDIEMTPQQMEAYTDMEERLFLELEGEPVTATVAASRLMKLREITGGFVISDAGKEMPINKVPEKMLELDELLEQSVADKMGDEGPPTKALIWAQYRWECKTLLARYRRSYGAQGLFGGISNAARDRAIREFKSSDKCRVLVCHPGSAGHGLTLTEASYAFYYSLSYNYEEFHQSLYRIYRPGQTRAMTYYFLVCPRTIDEDLLEVVREKKNLSDLITDGQFSRDDFLARRDETNRQQEIQWEVSDDFGGIQ